MVKQVLDIINDARQLTKDVVLTASEYDSSVEADIAEIRVLFNDAYADLKRAKVEEFRYEYDVTTVAGQVAYTLPVSTDYISSIYGVRLIDSDEGESRNLEYKSEEWIKTRYPNPDVDIPEGEVFQWWINTTDTAGSGEKELRFYNTPDDVYTIRFYLQDFPNTLTASQNTECSEKGDEWLKLEITASILESRGFAQAVKWRGKEEKAWKLYKANELKNNKVVRYSMPYFLPSERMGSGGGYWNTPWYYGS